MSNVFLRSIILLNCLFISSTGFAEPYVPQSNDDVIATWPVQIGLANLNTKAGSLEDAISVSEDLLARANQPGRSYLYGLADSTLAPWIKKDIQDASLRLNWARVQQQKHDFAGALESLEIALNLDPNNVNTHLVMARTNIILRDFETAKKSCAGLIRSGDLLGGSVCKLEVASYQGELETSYQSLKKIASSLSTNDPRSTWVNATLNDMAVRQDLWQDSEIILDRIYSEDDINTIIEWADAKLKLNKHQEVINALSPIVERIPSSEDAILIRLALAEKHAGSNVSPTWKQRVQERISLREQRQDLEHASDLAIYYLDLEPDLEKALNWAEINWQQSKEYKDEALLMRAKKLSAEWQNQSKG